MQSPPSHPGSETREQQLQREVEELRRQLQEKSATLARTREALRNAMDDAHLRDSAYPDLQFRFSSDGVILGWHGGQAAELYLPPDQFLGRRVLDVLPHAAGLQFGSALASHLATGELVAFEYTLPLAGRKRWYEGRFVTSSNGQIVCLVRDITSRKLAEEALRLSEHRYRMMFEQSPITVIVYSPDGRMVHANRAAHEFWGVSLQDIADYNILSDPTLDGTPVKQAILHGLSGRVSAFPPVPYTPPAGVYKGQCRWVSGVVYPISDGSGFPREIVTIQQDVTDQRQAEQALRDSEQHFRKLAESNRRLLHEVDHRVKNNLAGLLALVRLIHARATSVDDFASAIETRILGMGQIHQFLASQEWGQVPILDLIRSVTHGVAPNAPFSLDGPDIRLDPAHALPLSMILVEWCTNSSKYGAHSTPAGQVTITWSLDPSTRHVQLRWTESGGPPINEAPSPSLGTRLVESFAVRELAGRCALRYPPTGADHLLNFPHPSPEMVSG